MATVGDIKAIVKDVYELIQYARDVYHASKEREQLFREITLLQSTLDRIESAWNYYPAENRHEVDQLLHLVKQCALELKHRLKRTPRLWKNIMIWLMWPTQKADLEKAVQKIRDYNRSLDSVMIAQIGTNVAKIPDSHQGKCILFPLTSIERLVANTNEFSKGRIMSVTGQLETNCCFSTDHRRIHSSLYAVHQR